MRLTLRDLAATILVVAIAIPYAGYLLYGSVPFVQDPAGMAVVGLVLGGAAFLLMWGGDTLDRIGKTGFGIAIVSLGLGVVTLVLALTGTAGAWVLLAAFMASILVVWAIELMDHLGAVPGSTHHPTSPLHP